MASFFVSKGDTGLAGQGSKQMSFSINIDNAKSYATEKALMKRLETLGFANPELHSYCVVCNRAGRFTAMFSFHNNFAGEGGYIALYSQHGFITM